MFDLNLADVFLTAMTTYGPLALGLALLLGPLGLPIPTGVLMTAAGAFARQGLMSWGAVLALGLAATVLGDVISYALGRLAGDWGQRLFQGRRAAAWQRAQARFEERGGLAVYVTRVVLTALDVPTTLIAGSSRYAFRHFLAWDVAGRASWVLLYGGLGYLCGSQWPVVSQAASRYGLWLGGAAIAGMGLVYVLRRLRQGDGAVAGSLMG
jgi:membrane protein DedA with SNARE-associated domain